ncbi:MAG TPA: hypothetical protein VIV10_03195 [Gemmatimonadales bacterium]
MFRPVAVLVIAAALWAPPRVAGQRLAHAYLGADLPTTSDSRAALPRPHDGAMVLGGLAGGVVGFFAGGYAGAMAGGGNRVCGDDPCGLEEGVWGAAAGVSTFIPLGVHLANGRRGSYGAELAASLVVGAVGLGLAYNSNSGVPLLLVPVGQIVTSMLIERAAAKN